MAEVVLFRGTFVPELFLEQVVTFYDAAIKIEGQFFFFLFAQLPVGVAFTETFGEAGEGQRDGHGNVVALGESVHRETHGVVGGGEGLV